MSTKGNSIATIGSFFAKWAKWDIDVMKWFEFLNELKKKDVLGLINHELLIKRASISQTTASGLEFQKVDGHLYIDGQKIGLDWRFAPDEPPVREVPLDDLISSIPKDLRLTEEVFNFLLKNPDFIPEDWKLKDRNGNTLDIMFTGDKYHTARFGYFITAIKHVSGKWKEVNFCEEMGDIFVYRHMPIAVRQEAYLYSPETKD